MLEKKHFKILFFLELILILTLIDFITKISISSTTQLTSFFSFTKTFNSGSSFSLFSQLPYYNSFLIIFSILILLLLLYVASSSKILLTTQDLLLLTLVFSGISGNLIDRILYGAVQDIFYLKGVFIFNFADVYLTFGAIYLIYLEISKSHYFLRKQ